MGKGHQKLTYLKKKLFKELHKFRTETGFNVAAVVFSIAGRPGLFGDASLLERFMAEVVGRGGDLEFRDSETVESVKLGFREMEDEVKECVDCEVLIKMKIQLLELKDTRLKGVLTDEETEARSLESSSEFLKMLDSTKMVEMKDLVMSVMKITLQCDVKAFFICATKRSQSGVSRFHTCPGDGPSFLKLIHKCMNCQVGISKSALSKKVDVEKVALPTTSQSDDADDEIPSSLSISASVKQMVQRMVATELLQSLISIGSPVSQASVATVNQMSQGIVSSGNPVSQPSVAAVLSRGVVPSGSPLSQASVAAAYPMSQGIVLSRSPMSQARVAAAAYPMSQSIVLSGSPMSQASVVAAYPMSRTTVPSGSPISQANVAAAYQISQTTVTSGSPMSQANVSAAYRMSQATVSTGSPVSQVNVAAAYPMSQAMVPVGSRMSQASVAEVNQTTKTILSKRRSASTISKAEMVGMINSVIKLINVKLEAANAALSKQLGMNKPVMALDTNTAFVEDSNGNLDPCRKFL